MTTAKKASPSASPAKAAVKAAPPKQAPAKAVAAKAAPAKAAPPAKAAAPRAEPAAAAPPKAAPVKEAPKAAPAPVAAAVKKAPVEEHGIGKAVKGPIGPIVVSKDFDLKFLESQQQLLADERLSLTGQATRLEFEANALIEDVEMGDVQFDDESGEGDTMVVERERDLALSAQARQTVSEIDTALVRMAMGDYGYSIVSRRPIPRERLKAIPWAVELVEEKVGGIGRR
jgi:RNA polymerase-binding transcription factor DksA